VEARLPSAPALLGTLASDGWKKKYLEQGKPLINFVLALPTGGAVFHKVRRCLCEGACMGDTYQLLFC